MATYYFDYLVECVLMVGADEDQGLTIFSKKLRNSFIDKSISLSDIVVTNFNQQILAVISGNMAIFPYSKMKPQYPIREFIYQSDDFNAQAITNTEITNVQEIISVCNDSHNRFKDTDLLNSISRSSRFKSRRKSFREMNIDSGTLGSISVETIKSFPAAYFNNNLKISTCYKSPVIQFLTLTDNLGNRSYAVRLEIYKKFYFSNNTDLKSTVKLSLHEINSTDNVIYVPINIVLFSKYPCFDLMKELLSEFYHTSLSKEFCDVKKELVEISSILTKIPIIKSPFLHLSFRCFEKTYKLQTINENHEEITGWSVRHLTDTMSIDDIIIVLMAMFQEHKMVFLSHNPNLTTSVCQTLFFIFKPFVWKHFYMSDLPIHLYDLLDAIFPFMLGIPKKAESLLQGYDDLIIVDLVDRIVTVPKIIKLVSVSEEIIENVKKQMQMVNEIRYEYLSHILPASSVARKEHMDKINKMMSDILQKTFTEFMVDLFIEFLQNISIEKRDNKIYTNSDKFLSSFNSKNIEFFKILSNSDNVNCFIEDIFIKRKYNFWIKVCNRKYPGVLDKLFKKVLKKEISPFNECYDQVDVKVEQISLPVHKKARMDYFNNMKRQIDGISNELTRLQLLIEYYIQCKNKIKALEIIFQMFKSYNSEIDQSKVRKIIRSLNENELIQLKHQNFCEELCDGVQYGLRRKTEKLNRPPCVENFELPNINIPQSQFVNICKQAKIAEYETTVNNLFSCLTLDQKSKLCNREININTFRNFYFYWINNDNHNIDNEINFEEKYNEELIKVSNINIQIDNLGQGRLILTQFRLLFIPFGKKEVKEVIDFTKDKINKIKTERRIKKIGKLSECLEIQLADSSSKIVIWLREEIEHWHSLTFEVFQTNLLARLEKDVCLIDQMTEHCCVFENLVATSRLISYYKKNISDMTKKMLIYSQCSKDQSEPFNNEHRHYIINKVMPTPKLKASIDYVTVVKFTEDQIHYWCAICHYNRYYIKVLHKLIDIPCNLDMDSLPEIELTSRVKIMIYIDQLKEMLVACEDNCIYMINASSLEIVREIPALITVNGSYNCAAFSSQSLSKPLCKLYMGTTNGDILNWDFSEKQVSITTSLLEQSPINSLELYNKNTILVRGVFKFYILHEDGTLYSEVDVVKPTSVNHRLSLMKAFGNTIIFCFARIPHIYVYDISDLTQPKIIRKINMVSKKLFLSNELTDNRESSFLYIGISDLIPVTHSNGAQELWILYKSGTIEIVSTDLQSTINKFSGHKGSMSAAFTVKISGKSVVVTVGKEDYKMNVWKISKK